MNRFPCRLPFEFCPGAGELVLLVAAGLSMNVPSLPFGPVGLEGSEFLIIGPGDWDLINRVMISWRFLV